MSAVISTIVVNYNSREWLRRCVDSLLNCPLEIDIIAVENASTDGSLEALRGLSCVRIINRPVFVGWHRHKGMMRFYRKCFRRRYPGVRTGLVAVGVWLRFGLAAAYYMARRAGRSLGLRRG